MNIVINLQGEWDFRLDKEKEGLASHFEVQAFDDTIRLPGTVSQAKKGTPHDRVDTGHLTDPYEMEGYSWYRKTVTLPLQDLSELAGKHFELLLERTRISYVWIDDTFVGSFDSFVGRHRYDLTGFIKTLTPAITVMVSNTDYKVPGGHMTSPDTQTNWNGILGEITLTLREAVRFGAIDARCCYEKKGVQLHIPIQYDGFCPSPARIHIQPVLCRLKDIYAARDRIIPEGGNYEDLVEQQPLPEETGRFDVTLQPGSNRFDLFLDLSRSAMLWDEEDPYVYRLNLSCRSTLQHGAVPENTGDRGSTENQGSAVCDTAAVWCGLRSFTAGKTHFYINGRKTFLRGKHDGMIFPMTGYAPMDVSGWLHVMKIARDHGINHYRFHTCCPPEAAFIAADLLGIYMQPEISFWGTFNGPKDEGYDREAQAFLEAEGFRMLEAFSCHPSFCMMSMGNELWGNAAALDELLAKYKAFRPDILFAQGSNNFFWTPNIQPHDDFFSGVRFTVDRQIRGSFAMCDAPLGHVQTAVPGTRFNYDQSIRPSRAALPSEASADAAASAEEQTVEIQYRTGVKRVKLSEASAELIPEVPVISHEVGQYETYPDFSEIPKYTGVLKARNLEEFRRRLEEKDMLPLARDFFLNSGALAVACYKDELETALRSSQLAGFQLLDIQDFTGQGTALVGVLNAFMENKGLISAADWRRFCSDAVIQAEFDSYVVISEDTLRFTISLSYFRKSPLSCDRLVYSLTDSDGSVITRVETFVTGMVERGLPSETETVFRQGTYVLGDFCLALPKVTRPDSLTLTVSLTGSEIPSENMGSADINADSADTGSPNGCPENAKASPDPEDISNSYRLWIYPKTEENVELPSRTPAEPPIDAQYVHSAGSGFPNNHFPIGNFPDNVLFSTDSLPTAARSHRACLLFLSPEENKASIEGTYCTDFWCYPMFHSISVSAGKEVPVGTMGLFIRKGHAALSGFPCETYTTPQWHSIIAASRSTILDGTAVLPIVQTIDNFDRNHRLGLIYEIYLEDLSLGLLVCTCDLPCLMREGRPEAFALYGSLLAYLPRLAERSEDLAKCPDRLQAPRDICLMEHTDFCRLLIL